MLDFRGEIKKIYTAQIDEKAKRIEQASNTFLQKLLKALELKDITSINELTFGILQNNIYVEAEHHGIILQQCYSDLPKLEILQHISKILKNNEYTLEECGQISFKICLHDK